MCIRDSTGPYIDQKSYDYVVQALSGMAALQAAPGSEPALVRNIVIDKVTAMTAAQAVLAALLVRERARARGHDDTGQFIQLSMIDAALAFLWPDGMMQHTLLATDGRVTPGPHMADGYLVRRTADSYLTLIATSNSQFPGLCAALGTEEWLVDPRFATLADREANAAVLNDMIGAEIERHPGRALRDALHANDVPCALINQLHEVHLDPQVQHNATLVEHDRPWLGPVREPRPPARSHPPDTTPPPPTPPPTPPPQPPTTTAPHPPPATHPPAPHDQHDHQQPQHAPPRSPSPADTPP